MHSEKWRAENGECRVKSGGQRMESVEWRVHGEWRVKSGE